MDDVFDNIPKMSKERVLDALAGGARFDSPDSYGRTVLMFCAALGWDDVVGYLVGNQI